MVADPWKGVEKKYPVGSKHSGLIRNFTNYGIFVELEEGVDGLIHISDLSWSKKIKHPSEFANLGESIEIIILELDTEDRKVSLGHKQLEENPWEVFETVFTVDSVHKGTLTAIVDKGGIVTLPYGVEGFVPTRHLTKEDGTQVAVEESLDFKVLEFSKDGKRILLSHMDTHSGASSSSDRQDRKQGKKGKGKSIQKAVKEVRDSLEKTTLGDIDALSSLKSEMEGAEKAKEEEAKEAAAKDKKVSEEPVAEVAEEEVKEDEPTAEEKEEDTAEEESESTPDEETPKEEESDEADSNKEEK
ncbi:MAG: hypothetical protein COB85_04870 [Bacteroidetes bacterium]|nr:MAG: hypothetical protein COB85_04870 [Bacteroidota bacterium]